MDERLVVTQHERSVAVDKIDLGCETEFRLGRVARTLSDDQDLFALIGDPLAFSSRSLRFPSGPAATSARMSAIAARIAEEEMEMDLERWDGLG